MTREVELDLMLYRLDGLFDPSFRDFLVKDGFINAPASTKYHGDYPGGLFDHSRAVTDTLENLTRCNGLSWQRPESPLIIGMFHDICKYDRYKLICDDNGVTRYDYINNTVLQGHGAKSVMILAQFMRLTEEEVLCIRYHMGAYETDDWDGFDRAIRKYPNVLWTHHADMLASKVIGK